MMNYKTGDEFVSEEMQENTDTKALRLATVTQVEADGSPHIKFYGEEDTGIKTYKRLQSYTAAVGDTVVVGNINNSFFILGKLI